VARGLLRVTVMAAHPRAAGLEAGATNGPRLLLADHHRQIEEACSALRACAQVNGPRALVEQYRAFEQAVLDHLEAEETVILPDYAADHQEDAYAIREEHAEIRTLLFRIGVEVELHLVRLETLQGLIDMLHAHAAREDASMYPWAQVHLPLSTKRRLFVRIGRSLRKLAELQALVGPHADPSAGVEKTWRLPMKVSSLIQRNVISCTIHDDLHRAAQLMWDHDIGCLPVIDELGHVAGMITDRDICMAAYTQGLPLRSLPVTLAMAKHVFACNANDELDAVERTMSEHQIRRMPVIDDQGHPVGIISINDIARAASAGKVSTGEVASTLAAVSAPRSLVASSAA